MDGIHDLGGRDGFGPVVIEGDEPVFHEGWQGRVFALAGAAMMATPFGTPEFRHAMERMDPAWYLAASYHERWLTGIATLLVEKGILTQEELDASLGNAFPIARGLFKATRAPEAPDRTEPGFAVGAAVRVRNRHPRGHTRCPGYVRGKCGKVVRYDGPCNFDDAEAHAAAKRLEPLYCVAFPARELWGDDAEAGVIVHVDLFEEYLEAP